MRRYMRVLLVLALTYPAVTWAGNTHGSGPESLERAKWFGDVFEPFIVTGCLPPVPASSATLTAPACEAYVRGASNEVVYIKQASTTIGPLTGGDGTFWLLLHRNTTAAITDWTRQAGSHWLWRKVDAVNNQPPTTPAESLMIAKVTVASSVVTVVTDLGRHSAREQAVVYTSQFKHLSGGAQIQAAIDALPPSGGTVLIDPGIYRLTQALKIGNGGEGVWSTRAGVRLKGAGFPTDDPTQSSVWLRWEGGVTDSGRMIWVQGPLIGWGLQNLFLDGAGVADVGLYVQSAQMGEVENIIIRNYRFYGVWSTCVAAFGGNNTDSLHTRWQNVRIWNQTPAAQTDSVGINLNTSGSTCNTDLQSFYNTFILVSGVEGFGLRLGGSDSNFFWGLHVFADEDAKGAIDFDYTNPGGDGWPCNSQFFGGTFGPTTAITSTGPPDATTCGNMFWGWFPQGGDAPVLPGAQGLGVVAIDWTGTQDIVITPGVNQNHPQIFGNLRLESSALRPHSFLPGTTNVSNIGSATKTFKDLHLGGQALIGGLKTTGAASGKVVVCVDTATGQLYASSTGTDCSN